MLPLKEATDIIKATFSKYHGSLTYFVMAFLLDPFRYLDIVTNVFWNLAQPV